MATSARSGDDFIERPDQRGVREAVRHNELAANGDGLRFLDPGHRQTVRG